MTTETQTPAADEKGFYFLVAGSILFSFFNDDTQQEDATTIVQAAMVRQDKATFGVSGMFKAQQNLQRVFFAKAADASAVVRDVVVTNVCCLGEMTEAEFNDIPDEMQAALAQQHNREQAAAAAREAGVPVASVIRTEDELKEAISNG